MFRFTHLFFLGWVLLTGLSVSAQRKEQRYPCYFSAGDYWFGEIKLQDTVSLPFYFNIRNHDTATVIELLNGGELIVINEVKQSADSLSFKMPVFNSEFRLVKRNDSLIGNWVNNARKTKNILPFRAGRQTIKPAAKVDYQRLLGKWQVEFGYDVTNNTTKAIAVFEDPYCWDLFYGTFYTETGDYRYLMGSMITTGKGKEQYQMQTFDGSHAYVFKFSIIKDTIYGDYFSGAHYQEKWRAFRNPSFELQHPDSLVKMKPGFTQVDFSFKNLNGDTVRLSDKRYQQKVVIVQLMGSWCPNCLDESRYLSEYYKRMKNRGLEVVALAFERDTIKSVANLNRLKKYLDIQYEILPTQKTGKDAASAIFPMLTEVKAFPTVIIIDKKGHVRKIHTGYYGPATGAKYKAYTEEMERFIQQLLRE